MDDSLKEVKCSQDCREYCDPHLAWTKDYRVWVAAIARDSFPSKKR